MKIYRLRDCYLNQAERRVIRDGKHLDLTPKTFDVLLLLIENRGAIVTKDQILGEVWNGSFVEEGNLAVHISKLRRLLDETKTQQFIETVQGSGYRFVAPVQEIDQDEWDKIASFIKAPQENGAREWIFDSIAVLPLQNENGDAEIEYLADGLTESFINSLSRLPHLKVIARNTVFLYKNKPIEAKAVGETLGVATVLTGRIRIIKDHFTISIELTKTEDGTQLWGTQFNRLFTDIFEIQESILSEVLEKLQSEINKVSQKNLINTVSNNPESYRLYLKGKYLLEKWTEDNLYKAIEHFQRSSALDPLNVYSYVEIVECYFLLYFSDYITYTNALSKINPFISLISKLDQNVDVVQAMYGGKKLYFDWKIEEAEKHFKYALELNQNCLIARHRYPFLLLITERFSEALELLQPIMLMDPLSLISYKRVSRFFYRVGQFENAISYLETVLDLEPNDYESLVLLGSALAELGNHELAISVLKKSLNIQFNLDTLAMIGYVNALKGNKKTAMKIIEQIEFQSESNFQYASKLARIYSALGEKEIAFNFLNKALDDHDVDLLGLKSDPRWLTIIHDQRFREIILKIGL